MLTFWNKISKWYSKAVASGEEEPGAEDAHQVVLFLSMLDGLDDKHKDKRAADTLAYCGLMEGELVRLAIGYGEDYGAEHAVRSAASADFPFTLLYPGDAFSHTPFTDVVDMQPNKNGHGDDILRVMRGGVTVSEVGDACQIDVCEGRSDRRRSGGERRARSSWSTRTLVSGLRDSHLSLGASWPNPDRHYR